MKTQAIVQKIITSGTMEKRLFYVLASALLLLSFFYAYYVNATVMNVVSRKAIQTQITDLSSAVSELEFEYMSYKNTITLAYTKSLGFNDVNDTIFISRNSGDTRLTLRE